MTELVSASKPAFYIMRKSGLWLLSKISKRIQKKFFPIDLERLNIRLKRNPIIYANSENSYINIEFCVSNFSPYYDYGILSMECELWIWERKFINLISNKFMDMKVDILDKQLIINSSLGISEEKKARNHFGNRETAEGNLKINATIVTPFGLKSYKFDLAHEAKLIIKADENL